MIHVDVGSPGAFSTDPPFFPMAVVGNGFLAGHLPPHTIRMYMRGSSHFLALHNRSASFDVGMNTDVPQRVRCQGGEYLLGQKGMEFTFLSRSSVEVTVLHFEDAFVENLGTGMCPQRALHAQRPLGRDPQLEHVMGALRMALAEGDSQRMYVEHLAAAALLRALGDAGERREPAGRGGTRVEARRMQLAEDYMRAFFAEDISLADVAAASGLSVPYFSRRMFVKNTWGVCPFQALKHLEK